MDFRAVVLFSNLEKKACLKKIVELFTSLFLNDKPFY